PAAKYRAARHQMRRVVARRLLVAGGGVAWPRVRRSGARRVVFGHRRHAGIGLLLRQIDADADGLLEQRPFRELDLDEAPLAVGQVAEGGRLAEDILEDLQ